MLYDPKWEKETRADPFALEGLIAWLEKQPANVSYNYYGCVGRCLLGQYLTYCGFVDVNVGSHFFYHGPDQQRQSALFPAEFEHIAVGDGWGASHTFGAALKRARSFI